MADLDELDTAVLVDMLAKHMNEYTRLLHDGSREEFEECRILIILLQKEINSRRHIADAII